MTVCLRRLYVAWLALLFKLHESLKNIIFDQWHLQSSADNYTHVLQRYQEGDVPVGPTFICVPLFECGHPLKDPCDLREAFSPLSLNKERVDMTRALLHLPLRSQLVSHLDLQPWCPQKNLDGILTDSIWHLPVCDNPIYYTALLNAAECSIHLDALSIPTFSGQLFSYNWPLPRKAYPLLHK